MPSYSITMCVVLCCQLVQHYVAWIGCHKTLTFLRACSVNSLHKGIEGDFDLLVIYSLTPPTIPFKSNKPLMKCAARMFLNKKGSLIVKCLPFDLGPGIQSWLLALCFMFEPSSEPITFLPSFIFASCRHVIMERSQLSISFFNLERSLNIFCCSFTCSLL